MNASHKKPQQVMCETYSLRKCIDCLGPIRKGSRKHRCHNCRTSHNSRVKRERNKRARGKLRERVKKFCSECRKPLADKNTTGLCKLCYLRTKTNALLVNYAITKPHRCSCGRMISTERCIACDAEQERAKR